MDIEIKMPDLATTDDAVTLTHWLIEVGQPVRRGQPLFEIETDKAEMEVESVAEGTLKSVLAQPGDKVAVGQAIATVDDGIVESFVDQIPKEEATATLSSQPRVAQDSSGQFPDRSRPAPAPKQKGSMFTRNKESAAKQTPSAKDSMPLSVAQRTVGRRMSQSKQTIPHFYLQASANAEPMIARRNQTASQTSAKKIAWDAFVVQATAKALKEFPRMGYRLQQDTLVEQPSHAVGVAVDVDNDLYVVPVIDPLTNTIEQISDQLFASVDRIKQGDPQAKALNPATMTITNLGAAGMETFLAIINPPESAILSLGKIAPVAHVQDNQVIVQNRVSLSLSADHRIVNGKYAAAFLGRIIQELESI